jgi:hypothetical protein
MHRRRHRGPRPLLVLQWLIISLIIMVVMRSLGLPWFIWIFPLCFFWGGGWWGKPRRWKRRVHRRHHRRRHHDEYADDDEDDDIDYV